VLGSKAGFTAIVSAAFGPDRLLYELELSDAPGIQLPAKARLCASGQMAAFKTSQPACPFRPQ
jgi:hypothetical protein